MRKSVITLAILAAGLSSAAVAKDMKKATAPTASATRMTDAEMERVTAGHGYGIDTARGVDGDPGRGNAYATNLGTGQYAGPTSVQPGYGKYTAPGQN